VELVGQMLGDTNTVVLGPTMATFHNICPQEFRLIHPHFRKLAPLLVDFDEWSQIVALKVFLNYSRNQFCFPYGNTEVDKKLKAYKADEKKKEKELKEKKKKNSDNEEEEEDEDDEEEDEKDLNDFEGFVKRPPKPYIPKSGIQSFSNSINLFSIGSSNQSTDPDLRYLLNNVQPLLQSTNGGVVLGVATLLFYTSTENEFDQSGAARAVTRLIFEQGSGNTTASDIALRSVATMASIRPQLFEKFYKDFFVYSTQSTYGKMMRLKFLSHIANETSARLIMKEFAFYMHSTDKAFVCATIEAINRVAIQVPSLLLQCAKGCMGLLRSQNKEVVASAVVCVKNLIHGDNVKKGLSFSDDIQSQEAAAEEVKKMLLNLSSLLPSIAVPSARASVVWLLGTYVDFIPQTAPDALRVLVSGFANEEEEVKLQISTFANKICIIHCLGITTSDQDQTKTNKSFIFFSKRCFRIKYKRMGIKYIEISRKQSKTHKRPKSQKMAKKIIQASIGVTIARLFLHAMNLARFDTYTDVRERSRFYRQLLTQAALKAILRGMRAQERSEAVLNVSKQTYGIQSGVESSGDDNEQYEPQEDGNVIPEDVVITIATAIVSDRPKPSAKLSSDVSLMKYTEGSISHVIGKPVPGYKSLEQFSLNVDADAQKLKHLPQVEIKILPNDDKLRSGSA
ncbi:MAG: putative AP-3 complex subunit beta-2, partial [Streblomastix strix]